MGPMFADHYTINNINRAVIDDFINVFYNPSRMICVGVGIDHSKLERIASEAFGDLKNDEQFANIQHQEAKYTGGQLKMKYGFENNEDTHISLIFETENWKSNDLMALCVLNMIMGGVGSFSAGGPARECIRGCIVKCWVHIIGLIIFHARILYLMIAGYLHCMDVVHQNKVVSFARLWFEKQLI